MKRSSNVFRRPYFLSTMLSAVLLAVIAGPLFGQQAFYTFSSGPSGDGFTWDQDDPPFGLNDLDSGETFLAPTLDGLGQINFENYTENITFFDANYQAAGNSSVIDGDAWWGNPLDFGYTTAGASFFNTPNGTATSVAFDFAWAIAGQDAPAFLEIEAYDSDGDFAYFYPNLDSPFDAGPAFGNFTGWEGSISFDVTDLQEDNLDVDNIEGFYVTLLDIVTLDGTSEFAFDNFSVDGGAANEGSNVFPSFNSGMNGSDTTFVRNVLRDTGVASITQSVTNDGSEATTYSTEIVPGGDLTDPGQVSGNSINAGQTVFVSPLATLDTNILSGEYGSDFRFINDTNPLDPDDTLTHLIRVHDPPHVTDNSGATVQVLVDPTLSISNAAVEPHAGAIRAGVEIDSRSITGPFTITAESELSTEMVVGAGETRTGTLEFQRFGRLNGTYNGTVTIELSMVSENGSFLLNAAPVADVVWNLEYDLETTAIDGLSADDNSKLGPNLIGVNTALSAATLIEGETSVAQSLTMLLDNNPEQGDPTQSAELVSDVVYFDFNVITDQDLAVMQFTYLEENVPDGFTELDLRLLHFDTGTNDWVEAITGNSDGGAGSTFFAGSFADYMAGPGEESFGSDDLSAFGVDAANNQAWAVLNQEGLFALGVLGSFMGGDTDLDDDGDVDGTDFLLIQRNSPELLAQWQLDYGSGGALATQQTVPEPSTTLLAIFSVMGISLARWQVKFERC